MEIKREKYESKVFSWVLVVSLSIISLLGSYETTQRFKAAYKSLQIEVGQLQNQLEDLITEKELLEGIIEENNQERKVLIKKLGNLEQENEQLRAIRTKLTAYSPLDNVDGQQAEGNPARTSIGRTVGRKIAAADPKKLPYGTKLEIPQYGIVEIGDTGRALRSDNKNIRIDLFHLTYNQAMKFGVKDMEVKILEWGDKN